MGPVLQSLIALAHTLMRCPRTRRVVFDDLGEFAVLHDGEGWSVDATFAASHVPHPVKLKEASFTIAVRVTTPDGERGQRWRSGVRCCIALDYRLDRALPSHAGDMACCSLPATYPNSTKMEGAGSLLLCMHAACAAAGRAHPPVVPTLRCAVVAHASSGDAQTTLSAAKPVMRVGRMTLTAVQPWELPWPAVQACRVRTPKLSLVITQWSGWEAGLLFPAEAWASQLTW